MSKSLRYWRPTLLCVFLFGINAWICRELFSVEFLNNLSSNESTAISLARFFQEHGIGGGWFPWFNAGISIENVYQPLLPALAALAGKVSGWPIARAFHFTLALFYCLGPVTLFLFAWEWSEDLLLALVAGLAYSLVSPAEILIPILRSESGAPWGGLRLYNLVHYAEGAHNAALTLLPLALLFLHRAIVRRDARNVAAAVIFSASVVMSNAFGAVDLAIAGLCMVLALQRGLTILVPAGIAAYLWISPMLPPSLIDHMRQHEWGAHGYFNSGIRAWLSTGAVLAVFALIWLGARRLPSTLERFSIFLAFWMCIIPVGFFLLNLTLVPQANRYQLEMEIALCLCFACLCMHIPRRAPVVVPLVVVALVLLAVWQPVRLRRYARPLLQPVDITRTIEYKVDAWMDHNFPGQRTMISGDPEYLYNVFSNNPQMSGGHEPTAPNWDQLVAIFTIDTGMNAGARDMEYSILWLKAFGNQAIYVPAEKSRESYHPIAHPHKFDGTLPVLWHDEDDTIFAVPQRSSSLAHVIPKAAIVNREPIHGLDVEPLRPYVAALDDAALPAAEMRWEGTSRIAIDAAMTRDQVVSVQVNYAPGWRANVNGRKIPVHKDGIGLITLQPDCEGACDIRLEYGATVEGWICRACSCLVTFALVWLTMLRRRQ